MSKYKVIYADPPWAFNNKKTGGSMKSGASQQYDVMSLEEMQQMDVESLCDDNCLLVMWYVGAMPDEALALARAWGFRVTNMNGFVWDKETKHGKDFFGMGHITRASTESALVAVKGKTSTLIKDRSIRSRIRAKVTGHSAKPHEFRQAIEKLCGDVPRLEMFARTQNPGWDTFGNQVDNSIEIDSKEQAA
jgi:N6-adenosine-specific RNA methylase IME4